jgi:tRNA(Ile)-lysidine synthase
VKVLPPLVQKVGQFLNRHQIRPGGIVVAVSGGPDSMALLRALVDLRGALTPGGSSTPCPFVVAHFNHQLRGAESDADEAFVCEQHARLVAEGVSGLQICCGRADVAAQAQMERGNLETVARRLRYAWLAKVAQEAGLAFIATGHTADDQAETVLHRFLRGTGLKGLSGIAPRRRLTATVEVVRPILAVRRTEVVAYLDAQHQPYRQDSSNLNRRYTRTRLRYELLPHLLKHYNPSLVAVLGRLAEQAAEVSQAEERRAAALVAEAERPRAGALLVLDRQRLAAAPRQEVREAFRFLWMREGWPLGGMDFEAWDRLAAVVEGETAAVDLPGGIRARGLQRVVQVGKAL